MAKRKSHLSITEALDALTYLAELQDVGVETHLPLPEIEGIRPLSMNISEIGSETGLTEEKIREIFRVILGHIKDVYTREKGREGKEHQRVKSIMMLVGEAAKNLDLYTSIFEISSGESVTQFTEYKRLQEFYTKRVEKQVDEGLLSRWIMGLAGVDAQVAKRKARERKREKSKHVFVDLDMVKSDTEYELLLMRKEDGTRFFSPRLIRNIKLVCDFGGYPADQGDIFSKVHDWRDVICHVASIHMLRSLSLPMKRFYQEAFKYKGRDVVGSLNKGFMALMMCANPKTLRVNQKKSGGKTCLDYFSDFQEYLRQGLNTRDYQKFLAYPPKKTYVMAHCVLDVAKRICRALYLHMHIMQELFLQVNKFLNQARQQSPTTTHTDDEKGIFSWSKLAYDYAEIVKSLKQHAAGPLQRILDSLEEAKYTSFDTLHQLNLPHSWFDLYIDDLRVTHLRMGSPTRQTQINKAVVNDEFKGFLHSVARDGTPTHHLLINLQDRTSWRENSRCQVIEQLQKTSSYDEHLTAVTLAIDTPFYHQADEYASVDDAEKFMKEFKKQLRGINTGFYFPDKVKKLLFPKFVNETMQKIHEFFFNGTELLSQKDRMSFITLFYLFLELKLIDIVNPTSFSLSCKDAIDIGGTASVLLFVVMKLLHEPELTEFETEFIESMIYGPSILIRERALLPDVLNRTLRALQVIEGLKETIGFNKFKKGIRESFSDLYDGAILEARIELPVFEIHEEVSEAA